VRGKREGETTVTHRKLGKSDLEVSPLILGAWQYGHTQFWSEVPAKDACDVVARAVDKGITAIDTAIGYDGSEKMIGQAIKGIRHKLTIISKGGADPRKMETRVDISLSRMGLEVIDLYLVHYPDAAIPIEETMGGMMRLKEKGKIRHVGVSNFSRDQVLKAVAVAEVACCQQAYNLLWREIDDTGTLAACREHGVGILAYSPLGQGLFTGRIRSEADLPTRNGDVRQITLLFKGEAFQAGLAMVKRLDALGVKYGKTTAQVALNWVIGQEGITAGIAGSRTVAQLDDNLGALGWEMDRADREMLSREGLASSKLFDYRYSIFGMKYDEVKIDDMIESSL
jgi:aryl-alcohol dehydrogenase-like predicted oxidoreductase